jgi:hypothetical protein
MEAGKDDEKATAVPWDWEYLVKSDKAEPAGLRTLKTHGPPQKMSKRLWRLTSSWS